MPTPSSNPPSRQLTLPADLYGSAYVRDVHDPALLDPATCPPKHDLGSYIWLAYSIFFFIEPILRHSAHYWFQQLPIYALFLALYVAYVHFSTLAIRLPIVAAIFILGVLTIPFNVGGSSFFIYVAALLPFCLDSAAILLGTMVVECLTLAAEYHFYPDNPFNYLITGFFVLVVGVSNLFVAQNKRAQLKLQQAQQENVALAAVAERERIARDLHDVLGHTLSVIVLKAELAGRLLGRDDSRAAAEIADVERTARTALAEVREAIGGYRAKGIAAELDGARLTLQAAGVILHCDSPPPLTLPAREETVLALAVREAVTNIVRHAHATECRMSFSTTPDGFRSLQVEDNGAAAGSKPREGNGLRGMRERVQELGGRFRIEADEGTRLVIELPARALAAEQ